MKKGILKQMTALFLSTVLVMGGIVTGRGGNVEAAKSGMQIMASVLNAEIQKGGGDYISEKHALHINSEKSYSDVEIVLDDDLRIGADGLVDSYIFGNTTISASDHGGKLILDYNSSSSGLAIYGDLTINEGAEIVLNSNSSNIYIHKFNENGGNVYSWGNITYESAGDVYADSDVYIYDGTYIGKKVSNCMFYATNNAYVTGGDFSVQKDYMENVNRIITAEKNLKISGGKFECDTKGWSFFADKLQIDGGKLKVFSKAGIPFSVQNLEISGGNVVLDIYGKIPLSITSLKFSGGYLEMQNEGSNGVLYTGKAYDIAEDCYINMPENGEVKYFGDHYAIVDGEGNKASKVILKEKPDLSKAEITGVEDKDYTGEAITQSPVVKYNNEVLTEGKDYVVEYSNNINVGTATITFKPAEGSNAIGTAVKTFNIKEVKKDDGSKDDDNNDDGNKDDGNKEDGNKNDGNKDDGNKDNGNKEPEKYSEEWVNGKWYDADGKQTYDATLTWKQDETGWWVEDSKGWYPKNKWQKIDGKWYFFLESGYMDYSKYIDGCWLGEDGAWVEEYYGGHWMSDSTGWWYEDASGWYPVSRWVWIDGSCYYFEASGYMAVSKYIDGCWVGADGAWVQ